MNKVEKVIRELIYLEKMFEKAKKLNAVAEFEKTLTNRYGGIFSLKTWADGRYVSFKPVKGFWDVNQAMTQYKKLGGKFQ